MAASVIWQRFFVGRMQLIFNGSPEKYLAKKAGGHHYNLTDSDIVMPERKE